MLSSCTTVRENLSWQRSEREGSDGFDDYEERIYFILLNKNLINVLIKMVIVSIIVYLFLIELNGDPLRNACAKAR